jgi:hypothetical protein
MKLFLVALNEEKCLEFSKWELRGEMSGVQQMGTKSMKFSLACGILPNSLLHA